MKKKKISIYRRLPVLYLFLCCFFLLLFASQALAAFPAPRAFPSTGSGNGRVNLSNLSSAADLVTTPSTGPVPGWNPWINLQDGAPLISTYDGSRAATHLLEESKARPLSLAAADLDEDGVPDLIAGYADPDGGGLLAIYKGNMDSIFPESDEAQARKDAGTFTGAAFLSPAAVLEAPAAPDFLAAGDFDNDGHQDVVLAERNQQAFVLLPGNGRGELSQAETLPLDGAVTALAAGEINRRDGLQDLVVGIDTPQGAQILVFEGPGGALRRQPEKIDSPATVTGLTLGKLDDDGFIDLLAVAEAEMLVVHGRDRKLTQDLLQQAAVSPPEVDRRTLPFTATASTLGDFIQENKAGYQLEAALLDADGNVHILDAMSGEELSHFAASRNSANPILIRSKIAALATDDLTLLNAAGKEIQIIATTRVETRSLGIENGEPDYILQNNPWSVSLETNSAPVAALPMRLNPDGLTDLVVLQTGASEPVVILTAAANSLTVNDDSDLDDACAGDDGVCAATQWVDSSCVVVGGCTLRATFTHMFYFPGSYEISFDLGAGTPVIYTAGVSSKLSPSSVTILGRSGESDRIELRGDYSQGANYALEFGQYSSSNVARSLVVNGYHPQSGSTAGLILGGNGGSYMEDCYLGTESDGINARYNYQGLLVNSNNNTIGGSTDNARNVISGNWIGIDVEGGDNNTFLGNYIGVDAGGEKALPNTSLGIYVNGSNQTLGGTTEAARNIISGNGIQGQGMAAVALKSPGNLVQGNFIGVDAGGNLMGNVAPGITISGLAWNSSADNNTIGGAASGAGNLIAGSQGYGIYVMTYASGTLIQGNTIGADASGKALWGNSGGGVVLGVNDNTVGGVESSAGNIIAYNNGPGVNVVGGYGNSIRGNSIYGNAGAGIDLNNDGPTDNDDGDPDDGPNRLLNWPEIKSVESGSGNLMIMYSVNVTTSQATYPLTIDYYSTDSSLPGASGKTWLGQSTYNDYNAQHDVLAVFTPAQMPLADFIVVATATDAAGNTSEFTAQLPWNGTLVVNSTGDGVDSDLSDGQCWTGGTVAGGEDECTLRAAIETANVELDGQLISFDIPGGGVPVIHPQFALPTIAGPATIDGTTQPDTGKVELNGSQAGADANGLYIVSSNSSVRGLVIDHFNEHGVSIDGSNNTLQGNIIGLDAAGTSAAGNGKGGVFIRIGSNNVVGGVGTGAGNLISGNGGHGIELDSTGNRVIGNIIGLDTTGTVRLGNNGSGVYIKSSFENIIGGPSEGARNLISGNGGYGVWIASSGAGNQNRVEGNYIGVNASGGSSPADLGNNAGGMLVEGYQNTISGNVISGNGSHGLEIRGEMGQSNQVSGNLIGVYLAAGADLWTNRGHGVFISNSRNNTLVDNQIGVNTQWGVLIQGSNSTGNRLEGNSIGIDRDSNNWPNRLGGVLINNAAGNTIGGIALSDRNWISANSGPGIQIQGTTAANQVQNNYIGVDTAGSGAMGNQQGAGIAIVDASGVQIVDNLISGNEGEGVSITCQDNTYDHENKVQGNSIGAAAGGNVPLGNEAAGIRVTCRGNTIGGSEKGQGNLVSGNYGPGIIINRDRNYIQGNTIGLNAGGSAALSNESGLLVQGYGSVIGGFGPSTGNVIADGIIVEGTFNRLQGNIIGVNAAGTSALASSAGNTGVDVRGDYIKVSDNLISGWQVGVLLPGGSTQNQLLQNRIGTNSQGTSAIPNQTGIWLAGGSQANRLRLNQIAFNCTNVLDEGDNSIFQNTIVQGACNTGILCSGCTSQIGGNQLADDQDGDGIRCDNGGAPQVYDNTILDNFGYGLRNLDPSIVVDAQNNWWGSAGGPGGEGPGSGDEVSEYVDYAPWRTEPLSLTVAVESDPLYAARGATVANQVYVQNWDHPADTITITLTDALGWLVPPETFILTTANGLGASGLISVSVPAGASLGIGDLVTVTAVSQTDPTLKDSTSFTVIPVLTADLYIIKEGPDQASAASIEYTITITNYGPDPANNVIVTDTLPVTLTYQLAQPSQGNCAEQGSAVVCWLGAIEDGETATIIITAVPTAGGEVVNSVTASANEHDPDPTNNIAAKITSVSLGSSIYLPLVMRSAP